VPERAPRRRRKERRKKVCRVNQREENQLLGEQKDGEKESILEPSRGERIEGTREPIFVHKKTEFC
jgi:hypothetical protein